MIKPAIRYSSPIAVILVSLLACTSTPDPIGDNPHAASADPGEKLIFSFPGDLPSWANEPGVQDNDEFRHFTGLSRKFTTEADARKDSLVNAREQIADYLRTDVARLVRQVSAYVGSSSDIIDPGTVSDSATRMATETTVLGTAGRLFYAEKWQQGEDRNLATYWKVYVSVPLPRSAEYDLALASLQKQSATEKDEMKKRNLDMAIKRLEELKAKGWFEK